MKLQRLFQIRLRTLLAFMTFVCIVLAFCAQAQRAMVREDTAVEVVRGQGGIVTYEGDTSATARFVAAARRIWPLYLIVRDDARGRPDSVTFRDPPQGGRYTDEFWQALAELPSIRALCLPDADWFPAEAYGRIPHLPQLSAMVLARGTTPEDVEMLVQQPSVQWIELHECELTRALTEQLTQRFPNAHHVDFACTRIAVDSLCGFDGMSRALEVLLMWDSQEPIAEIVLHQGNQIDVLSFSHTNTRQLEIAHFPRLRKLDLYLGRSLENAAFVDLPKLGEIAVNAPHVRVSQLPTLRTLVITACTDLQWTDAPALTFAVFTRCQIPAEQLTWIAECRDLRKIVLYPIGPSAPEVLRELARCSSLENLTLESCHELRTEHVAALAELNHRINLSLIQTHIEPQNLERLLSTIPLQRLTVSSRWLAQLDADRLRAAHPEIQILVEP